MSSTPPEGAATEEPPASVPADAAPVPTDGAPVPATDAAAPLPFADAGESEEGHDAEPATGTPGDGRRPRRTVAAVASLLVLLLVAGVVGLVLLGRDLHARRVADDRRAAVLDVAQQAALNFTTYDYKALDKDFKAVLDVSTDPFKSDYQSRSSDLKTLIADNKVEATGKVISLATVQVGTSTAEVIAAVDNTVVNSGQPDGKTVHYRFDLRLKRVHGQWLLSQLEPA